MGGALRRPTKFDCGAALQQSSNIFYQKLLKINSVRRLRRGKGPPEAGIGLRGKGILRLGSEQVAAAAFASLAPPFGGARFPQNFSRRLKIRKRKEEKMCRCLALPVRQHTLPNKKRAEKRLDDFTFNQI